MIPVEFTCYGCQEVRLFHSQAVIVPCIPEDAQFWVVGIPCIFTGFCVTCLGDEE